MATVMLQSSAIRFSQGDCFMYFRNSEHFFTLVKSLVDMGGCGPHGITDLHCDISYAHGHWWALDHRRLVAIHLFYCYLLHTGHDVTVSVRCSILEPPLSWHNQGKMCQQPFSGTDGSAILILDEHGHFFLFDRSSAANMGWWVAEFIAWAWPQ
jgi:hypothetical protein